MNSCHIKNISWKFDQNLMNQIKDILYNVHFGPDSPICPAHFCHFCHFSQEPESSWGCGCRENLVTNNTFHFSTFQGIISCFNFLQKSENSIQGRFRIIFGKNQTQSLFIIKYYNIDNLLLVRNYMQDINPSQLILTRLENTKNS